ncbi:hypothetical protein [Sphingomonas jeddahensis]|uniref:Squalene/phytoene synthase n=1 Tax=Sphingomonas jeddahensis TaxID=1915074 RepID=A0A1V2ES46_9SPHN|nr:hypothetical protein [Sphingomonas jeddahensis]ONF95511.1 hypothetical protein SPHI_24100 [Sphingomonas jeddahensis]
MVNDAETFGIDPAGGHAERVLALGYAPARAAPGIAAAFALDATLAKLALGTRDPMVAQLRLTWWHEALRALGGGVPPAQPILQTLAIAGADGTMLAAMSDGWEHLLAPPSPEDMSIFAVARGQLFEIAARLAGARDAVADAGQGWALADLAQATADPTVARIAAGMAEPLLKLAAGQRWSGEGRFLGALVHIARADLAGTHPVGAPRRVARLAWHRMTGR